MTDKPLDISRIGDLCEAFSQSDLPFQVDIVDWANTSESFQRIIEEECIVVQKETNQINKWRKFTIGEIADIVGGGTPSTKESENFDGNIPWLTPRDLSGQHDRYIGRGKRNLSQKGLESSSAKLVPASSVLLSTRAPIGYVALAKNPIATNQGFRNLLVKEEFSPEYLYYWLIQNTEELKRHASGSTFSELSGSALRNIELYLPPFPVQQAIATILGTLDDKIELNRQMSETLEEMAQALFKSWFVDFDPVRAKMEGRDPGLPKHIADLFSDRLVESELGKIPEGWEVKLFEDIVNRLGDNINPLTCPDSVFSHFSIPAYDQGRAPKQELGEDIKSTKTRVPPGTVLLSKLNPEIERVWLVDVMEDETAICSTEFLVLQAKPPIQRSYIYCLACSSLFREQVKSLVTGTSKSHQRAQANAITKLEVIFPTGSIVQEFESRSSGLLDHSLACRREIKILTALRDVLLPKLVSGELKTSSIQEPRTG